MSMAANESCSEQCTPTVSPQSAQQSCNWTSLSLLTMSHPRLRWGSDLLQVTQPRPELKNVTVASVTFLLLHSSHVVCRC